MEEKHSYTLKEAEQYFAKALNGEVWELLGKADRTALDDERMLYAAYASCYHWLQAGTGAHQERGEWLIAHVCTVLGLKDEALRHASRCLELTQQHPDLMKDFDVAYGFEAMAPRQCPGRQPRRRPEILPACPARPASASQMLKTRASFSATSTAVTGTA